MEKVAKEMVEKGITKEDNGAVLIDFAEVVPGKEGKGLEKAVLRYVQLTLTWSHLNDGGGLGLPWYVILVLNDSVYA